MEKNIITGEITYKYADLARYNDCDISGKYFEKNPKLFFQKIIFFIFMGGNQITTFNGPKGLSFNAVKLGNANKVYWINKVVAFERLPPYVKYQRYITIYNLLPGQRRRFN